MHAAAQNAEGYSIMRGTLAGNAPPSMTSTGAAGPGARISRGRGGPAPQSNAKLHRLKTDAPRRKCPAETAAVFPRKADPSAPRSRE